MSLPSRGGTGRLSQLDSDLPACADRESPERTDRCHRPRVGDLHWPFDSRPGSPALTGQRVQAGSSKRGPRRGDHHGSVQCDTGELCANPEAGRPGVARDDGRSGRAGADQEVSETGSRQQNRRTTRCLRVTDAAVPLGQSRSSIHGTINPTGATWSSRSSQSTANKSPSPSRRGTPRRRGRPFGGERRASLAGSPETAPWWLPQGLDLVHAPACQPKRSPCALPLGGP